MSAFRNYHLQGKKNTNPNLKQFLQQLNNIKILTYTADKIIEKLFMAAFALEQA